MTGSGRRPLSGRELWRRLRASLIAAISSGAVLGVLADLAARVNTASQDRVPPLVASAGLGVAIAATGCLGAAVAVALKRPRIDDTTPPIPRIAAGAGLAVVAVALLVACVWAALSGSADWFAVLTELGVLTGMISAAGAAVIVAVFGRRWRDAP